MLGQGTGTLVGRCTVVTNEHVVSRGGAITAAVGDSATFYVGVGKLEGGFAEWARAEIVAVGPRATSNHFGDDWAILRLDRPLGDKYGTVAAGGPDNAALAARPLWALGFPGDGAAVAGGYRSLWSHKGCHAVAAEGNVWLVDCAGNRGQSGGPILMPGNAGEAILVAMLTAVRRAPALGTQAAAAGNAQPLAVATAIRGFAPVLKEKLDEPCPDEKPPPRLR
jgi:protease YdgD